MVSLVSFFVLGYICASVLLLNYIVIFLQASMESIRDSLAEELVKMTEQVNFEAIILFVSYIPSVI